MVRMTESQTENGGNQLLTTSLWGHHKLSGQSQHVAIAQWSTSIRISRSIKSCKKRREWWLKDARGAKCLALIYVTSWKSPINIGFHRNIYILYKLIILEWAMLELYTYFSRLNSPKPWSFRMLRGQQPWSLVIYSFILFGVCLFL